eukprot:scaffold153754_cov19-Prasinocladus_malaysianus.AAC.1
MKSHGRCPYYRPPMTIRHLVISLGWSAIAPIREFPTSNRLYLPVGHQSSQDTLARSLDEV